jgi:hypothetical protein
MRKSQSIVLAGLALALAGSGGGVGLESELRTAPSPYTPTPKPHGTLSAAESKRLRKATKRLLDKGVTK